MMGQERGPREVVLGLGSRQVVVLLGFVGANWCVGRGTLDLC